MGSYALTLKRIGVFVYLTLAVSGLAITLLKVVWGKTNFFILRNLYWAFILILGVNNCLDWSRFITHYNIKSHIQNSQSLDWSYLLSLDERNLLIILRNREQISFETERQQVIFKKRLYEKAVALKQTDKDWREMSLAKNAAQSKIVLK